jgi:hypothetical protein
MATEMAANRYGNWRPRSSWVFARGPSAMLRCAEQLPVSVEPGTRILLRSGPASADLRAGLARSSAIKGSPRGSW